MQHDFTFIVFISLIRLLLFCFFTFVGFLICLTVLSLDVMIWSFRCLKWKNCLIVENAGIYIAKLAVSRTPHNDIVIHYILWSLLFFFLYEVLFKMMSNLYSMEKEINSREFRFSLCIIYKVLIYEILDQLFFTDMIAIFQALDTFNTAIVSPIYYVMFTTLTILASVIMFKV